MGGEEQKCILRKVENNIGQLAGSKEFQTVGKVKEKLLES